MASETDIRNMSLARLRVSKTISALDEQSAPARILNQFYSQCRQEVLRAFPWGCATRATQLAQVSGQTFPGWTYVYQYPASCLMVRCVADESGTRLVNQFVLQGNWDRFNSLSLAHGRQPWQVALKDDNASQVLLSDVPNAWAFFTADLDNAGVFSADLSSAIAWRLAIEAGPSLQADAAMIDRAERGYAFSISQASAQSFNESRDDVPPDSPSISCRM